MFSGCAIRSAAIGAHRQRACRAPLHEGPPPAYAGTPETPVAAAASAQLSHYLTVPMPGWGSQAVTHVADRNTVAASPPYPAQGTIAPMPSIRGSWGLQDRISVTCMLAASGEDRDEFTTESKGSPGSYVGLRATCSAGAVAASPLSLSLASPLALVLVPAAEHGSVTHRKISSGLESCPMPELSLGLPVS